MVWGESASSDNNEVRTSYSSVRFTVRFIVRFRNILSKKGRVWCRGWFGEDEGVVERRF